MGLEDKMISVIDDLTPKETQDKIEQLLLADSVQWYYIGESSGDSRDYEIYGGVNHPQYYHVIYNESLLRKIEDKTTLSRNNLLGKG